MRRWEAWLAWIVANAAGETAGLGLVFACGATMYQVWGELRCPVVLLTVIAATVLLASLEGAIVGWAQWLVLRRIFPISAGRWVVATVAGAVVAWFIGMLPGAFAATSVSATDTVVQPTAPQIAIAAAAIGLAGGVVLSFAQWRVLRQVSRRAIWWLPANAVAWTVAMPFIFEVVSRTIAERRDIPSILLFVVGLAAAGGLVGAIHGAVLVSTLMGTDTTPMA